ncbi:MAG: NmrA family NAD(P)-binding protein [Chloroflexota bacterium]|nr:NmrA family NAD(P)-binding protein [Chloroflexota bacterium]
MTLTGQQVLITGASGFLGGALAQRLAGASVRVRALVRNPAALTPSPTSSALPSVAKRGVPLGEGSPEDSSGSPSPSERSKHSGEIPS